MNLNNTVFAVSINKIKAELEISDSKIKCITGSVVHFDIPKSKLRSVEQIRYNKVLFLFYYDEKLTQSTITSKFCSSIVNAIFQT